MAAERLGVGSSGFVPAATVGVIALFAMSMSIVATTGQPYDTDTGHMMAHMDRDFDQFIPWFGFVARAIMYAVVRLFGLDFENIVPLCLLCATIAVAALAHGVRISANYRLLGGGYLVLAAVFIGVNDTMVWFGSWAVITYPMALLSSTLALNVLLWLDPADRSCVWGRACIGATTLAILAALNPRCMLPGAVIAGILSMRLVLSRPLSGRGLLRSLCLGLVLVAPMAAAGLLNLYWFPHAEMSEPRKGLWPLYFTLADYPQTLPGGFRFVWDRYTDYLRQCFLPTRFAPLTRGVSWAMPGLLVLWHVGMVRSLFLYKTKRFVVAAYLWIVLLGLITMSLLGMYAFGKPRYALFIHVPVLIMLVVGCGDVVSALRAVFSKAIPQKGRLNGLATRTGRVALPAFCALLLLLQGSTGIRMLLHSQRYQREWRRGMQLVKTADPGTAVVFDRQVWYSELYFKELAQPDAERDAFDLDGSKRKARERLDEFGLFLDGHNHFFSVTGSPIDVTLGHSGHAKMLVSRNYSAREHVQLDRWNLKYPWYFVEWFSKDYSFLHYANDFSGRTWMHKNEVRVVRNVRGDDSLTGRAQRLTLGPYASLWQSDGMPVEPGETAAGEILLWADDPVEVSLLIESRGGRYEGAGSPVNLSRKPTLFAKQCRFRETHSSAALALANRSGSEVTLYAWDARLTRESASTAAVGDSLYGWMGIGAAIDAMPNQEDGTGSTRLITCMTSEGSWDGVGYGYDENGKPDPSILPCKPNSDYIVMVDIKGLDNFAGTRLHLAVYDQDGTQLCAPGKAISTQFTRHSATFTTRPASRCLGVKIIKAKSPDPAGFLVRNLMVSPQIDRSALNDRRQ